MLINRMGMFVLPFLALYLTQERGLSVESAGLIATVYGAGTLAAGPIGGVLSDRVGRRATMVLGLALGAAAMIHLGFARSPTHIATAAFLLGLVGDLYRPAVWAAVSDVVPAQDRLRAFGFLYWAINLGFACASVLAGTLAAKGFWLLFAGDAATSLIMALVVFAAVPETKPEHADPRARSAAGNLLVPFGDGIFMSFVLLNFFVSLMFMQHTVALPLDMAQNGLQPKHFGGLIAINGVLIVLLQPFVAQAVQSRARGRVLALAALLVGVGFGMTGLARSVPAYGVSIAVWTMGELLMSPVTPTVVADLAPLSLRGTYQGVHQMAWGAASCLAPALGSLALSKLGSSRLWAGCLLLGALVSLGHLAIAAPRRQRLLALGAAEVRD
jgi:MFS family permease